MIAFIAHFSLFHHFASGNPVRAWSTTDTHTYTHMQCEIIIPTDCSSNRTNLDALFAYSFHMNRTFIGSSLHIWCIWSGRAFTFFTPFISDTCDRTTEHVIWGGRNVLILWKFDFHHIWKHYAWTLEQCWVRCRWKEWKICLTLMSWKGDFILVSFDGVYIYMDLD